VGTKDHGVVTVGFAWLSVALDGPFHDQLQGGQVSFEEKVAIQDELVRRLMGGKEARRKNRALPPIVIIYFFVYSYD
jgi:hypothetical protein